MTTTIFNKTIMKGRRRELRKKQTPQEKRLWDFVRGRQLGGAKFRRQYSVGGFVLDFYCPELRLAVEIDGPIHCFRKRYDRYRQSAIEGMRIGFLRFTNTEIECDFGLVTEKIKSEAERLRSTRNT
jgi:very-short-patch-repair endonuclease